MARAKLLLLCVLALAPSVSIGRVTKPFPRITEQFSMTINMTRADTGQYLGLERMWWDLAAHRSHIFVELVNEPNFGQIVFGRPSVNEAWFVQYVEESSNKWQCTNKTVQEQWSEFWTMGPNPAYLGSKIVNGVDCDQWKQTEANGDFSVLSVSLKDIPVAIEIKSGGRLFFYSYVDFVAGPPPVKDFFPPSGAGCAPAGSSLLKNVSRLMPLGFIVSDWEHE